MLFSVISFVLIGTFAGNQWLKWKNKGDRIVRLGLGPLLQVMGP